MNATKKQIDIRNLTAAAVCLALSILLPYLTGRIQQLGTAFSPMHIPILLCGFVCGPYYAAIIGAAAPFLNHMVSGMPMLPMASVMSPELAVYGLAAGLLYRALAKKKDYIYVSLIGAMIAGRVAFGIAGWLIFSVLGIFEVPFTWGWEFFVNGALITAAPGIILHIVLIPVIVMALQKARFITAEQ
ncbi:MAG: ECF transporter S component [Oscillospiraceae bacterium]|nr:ECF transporter S component [Oscillospiraceae bacterium]